MEHNSRLTEKQTTETVKAKEEEDTYVGRDKKTQTK